MKISSKPKDKKKDLRDFCLYFSRLDHIEEKYYYKHLQCISQNFQERFRDQIWVLQSKANAIRSYTNIEIDLDNTFKYFLSENQGFIVQAREKILATKRYDKNWYCKNVASYYMTFNLADF